MRFLIKRGGGKGPMKPGNLAVSTGANSCRISWKMRWDHIYEPLRPERLVFMGNNIS
jgi:hypothetical protein